MVQVLLLQNFFVWREKAYEVITHNFKRKSLHSYLSFDSFSRLQFSQSHDLCVPLHASEI